MKKLHMDFETYSEADIRKVGAYRYAADPSTVVLCCAFAFDDGPPSIWHPRLDAVELFELEPYFEALQDPSVLILAHNCMFERAIFEYVASAVWGIPFPDMSRFHCTMSMARRATLPAKLETLAEMLELPLQKDKRGKALIKKFCEMQSAKKPTKKNPNGMAPCRIKPEDDPSAFLELLEYCKRDVAVEQLVFKKLEYFFEPINNDNYSLDAVINARGVPVNLSALRHAQKLIEEETEIVSTKFRELVGIEVTQGAKILEWIEQNAYLGVGLPDLQAETIEEFLEPYEGKTKVHVVVEALRMRQSISYAAIKKVKTMLVCAGPHDNRIRGLLNHHGASTGRWTASLVQMQNMKRASDNMAEVAYKVMADGRKMFPHEPGFKDAKGTSVTHSEGAYRMICEGVDRETLELCYGPVLEVISSCIRHFVEDTL